MAKAEKELQELQDKNGKVSREINELTDEELNQVAGGKPISKSEYNNSLGDDA